MNSPSDGPRPLFLVWLRSFDRASRPQLVFEADKSGKAPLLTKEEQGAFVRAFPITDDVAHLPLDKLARLHSWRKAA